MPTKTLRIAIATLILGLIVGYFVGRATLEAKWENPISVLSAEDVSRHAANGADATPPAGTRIVASMPLGRTRQFVKAFTKDDPLVMTVGAIANGDDGASVHVRLENRGKCTVNSFRGVAYGFDARGKSTKLNRNGEHFVSFFNQKAKIAPHETTQFEQPVHFTDTASLVVAQIDELGCEDGTKWKRP